MSESKTASTPRVDLGPLTPVAISMAPELARWLFGDQRQGIAAAIAQAAEKLTGTADAAAQRAAIETDADLAGRLRVEFARIAGQAEAQASTGNSGDAAASDAVAGRAAFTPGEPTSPISYGAVLISVAVLATFAAVMVLMLLHAIPPGSDTILNVLLGSLAAMATSVVSYWVGSSAGSARKDDRIARLASAGNQR